MSVLYCQKYDTIVGSRDCEMSTGQRQQLAIARALIRKPKLLIVHEVDADRFSVGKLAQATASTTVLFLSHRLKVSTPSVIDWIVLLDNGRQIESGKYHTLSDYGKAFLESRDQEDTDKSHVQ